MKLERKKNALKRLEKQLSDGVKTIKGSKNEKKPLSDSDIKRIVKEIEILKTKINAGNY